MTAYIKVNNTIKLHIRTAAFMHIGPSIYKALCVSVCVCDLSAHNSGTGRAIVSKL